MRFRVKIEALISRVAPTRTNIGLSACQRQHALAAFSTSSPNRYARRKGRGPKKRKAHPAKAPGKASSHHEPASDFGELADATPGADMPFTPEPVEGLATLLTKTRQDESGSPGAPTWLSLSERLKQQSSSEKARSEASKPEPAKKPTSSKRAASTKSKKAEGANIDVKTLRPRQLRLDPIYKEKMRPIPKLNHSLDRVLFNHGVYQMQDPRSGVFNFDPYLASIMPVEEFDFDALKDYITSSQDTRLRNLAAKHGKKFCCSTSSMTSILSHFHYLLSAWRMPNFDNLSRSLVPESTNFTALTRGPAAAFARFEDGVYAIDADKQYDSENILSLLGKSMEKLLTLPKEDFEKYRRGQSHQLTEDEKNTEESYHYTTLGDFMMRSQLDAQDHRLPGTGVFDLKTRAVVTIRMDVQGYKKGVGYEIRKQFGQWESFEREYYDLIRAAFLKYSLQVRMGRMDGIFVAYHNTQRIFGFQYISLSEMDHAIHGTTDTELGDQEFKASVTLLNDLLNRATERFPGKNLRLHVETRPTKVPLTYFFVEPVSTDNMRQAQEASKPSVEQLEKEIRGLSQEEQEAETARAEAEAKARSRDDDANDTEDAADAASSQDRQGDSAWEEMMAKVEETVENESFGVRSVREAVQDALEQSGLLKGKTEAEIEKQIDKLASALTEEAGSRAQSRADETPEEIAENETETSAEGSGAVSSGRADSTNMSLKDLILKVTADIDERTADLATLHRIFAGLSAKSETDGSKSVAAESDKAERKADGAEETVVNDEAEETVVDASTSSADEVESTAAPELLGMYVTIRNKVKGQYVDRPTTKEDTRDWSIEYAISEIPEEKAQGIYAKIKRRRKSVLSDNPTGRSADWYRMFRGRLPEMAREGAKYRQKRQRQEEGKSIYVAWDKEPLSTENDTSGR